MWNLKNPVNYRLKKCLCNINTCQLRPGILTGLLLISTLRLHAQFNRNNLVSNRIVLSASPGTLLITPEGKWMPDKRPLSFTTVGLDFDFGLVYNRERSSFEKRFAYHRLLSEDYAGEGRTISMNGFKLVLNQAGIDIFPGNKKFDLLTGAVLTLGRIYQEADYPDGTTSRFRNNITLIGWMIHPRYVTKYITFSVRGFYDYDVSAGNWKGNNKLSDRPLNTKLSMYGATVGIGWTIY